LHALSLDKNTIDLWFVFLDDIFDECLIQKYRSFLTTEERYQEQRFYFAKDRLIYLVTRVTVRMVLSRYISVAPEDLCFVKNAYGKPAVADSLTGTKMVSFNVSHTDGLVLLGVTSERAIGVDVENIFLTHYSLQFVEQFFTKKEVSDLHALPESQRKKRFFELWTLKESYVKAKGMGLSIPLDHFRVSLPDDHRVEIIFDKQLTDDPSLWEFSQYLVGDSHVAAICAASVIGVHDLYAKMLIPFISEVDFKPTLLRRSQHR